MPVQWWQILLSVFGALLSFCSVAYWTRVQRRDKAQEHTRQENSNMLKEAQLQRTDILDRLTKLELTLAIVDQKIMPISTAMQTILVKELTHYHTPVMDGLLARIGPPSELNTNEELQLEALLLERTEDMGSLITSFERDAAFILPAVMRRAKREALLIASGQPYTSVLKFVIIENTLDK